VFCPQKSQYVFTHDGSGGFCGSLNRSVHVLVRIRLKQRRWSMIRIKQREDRKVPH
jgi:hypothetical protein